MTSNFFLAIGQAINNQQMEEQAEKLEELTKPSFWAQIDWLALLKPLALALVILIVGYNLIKLVVRVLRRVLEGQGVNGGLIHFILVALQGVLYFILATIIAGNLGFKTTSLVALIGTLGISIGLALQGSLSDLASGILLVLLQPIRVKDYVYIEGMDGLLRVQEIRLFQTVFVNFKNVEIYAPNKKVLTSVIENLSKKDLVGAQVRVVVNYEEDVDRVLAAGRAALEGLDSLDHTRGYSIFLDELLDYGVAYVIRGFATDQNYATAVEEVATSVKETFQKEGISFAKKTIRLEGPSV